MLNGQKNDTNDTNLCKCHLFTVKLPKSYTPVNLSSYTCIPKTTLYLVMEFSYVFPTIPNMDAFKAAVNSHLIPYCNFCTTHKRNCDVTS